MTIDLDDIARSTKKASLRNAIHACREGHPWNKTAKVPFYNAWVVGCQSHDLNGAQLDWLRKQAVKNGEIER